MANVGYATLAVIPSFAGFGQNLNRGMAAPMVAAGAKAGTTAGAAASKGFGSTFQRGIAGVGPKLLGGLGLLALGKQVVSIQGQFEASMNTLAAAADVPAGELRRLGNFAKKMGADTVFTANEAADAMVELAKAGITPAQIQAGALKGTMSLAATEGLRLADAATIMSNAMTTFGIEGDKAVSVADALAGASKASTASVESISQAMSQVGGSARDAGLNLQETTAALAAFDQQGIKGSDAGTSLKTMLSRLVPQTRRASNEMRDLGLSFTDSNGEFVSLEQMAGRMRKAFQGLSDEERTSALNTIFGSDARRAALALINEGSDGIRGFIKETSKMGTAQKLADARMNGTAGAIERMRGAAEKAGLALGEVLAPGVVTVANSGAALADSASGMVDAFSGLPAPVKAAAGAFAALKLAELVGLTGRVSAGAGKMGGAFTSLRIRAMLAGDAFREARAGSLVLSGNTGKFTAPVGRMSAALKGLQTAGQGVGSGLRKGLGGAIGMLGGPWGIAIAGGVAALAHFQAESAASKARIESMTEALDAQTGGLTKNNRELAIKTLQESGALKSAKDLGLNLKDVTDAALGNEAAIKRVASALDGLRSSQDQAATGGGRIQGQSEQYVRTTRDINAVNSAITGQNSELNQARSAWRDHAEAMGTSTTASHVATKATHNYAKEIEQAAADVQTLYDAEQKRRDAAVAAKRDQIALIQTQIEARREANKGKRTLDEQTKAGRENWNALLDLADQWNQSEGKVRNARGAYKQMRETFIDVAKKMGATDEKAKHLADRFLKFPKRVQTDIKTPGMDAALERLRRLRQWAELMKNTHLRIAIDSGGVGHPGFQARAAGGPVRSGTSYLVGERGPEILTMGRASGYITPNHKIDNSRSTTNRVTIIHNGNIITDDPRAYERRAQELARREAGGGVNF
jgi:TP901 family phage tail tape measure protein